MACGLGPGRLLAFSVFAGVTAGCPAAHADGFEFGGLQALEQRLMEGQQLHGRHIEAGFRRSSIVEACGLGFVSGAAESSQSQEHNFAIEAEQIELERLRHRVELRQDQTLSQAVGQMAAAFYLLLVLAPSSAKM